MLFKFFYIPYIGKSHNKSTIWSFLFCKWGGVHIGGIERVEIWTQCFLVQICSLSFGMMNTIIQTVQTAEMYLLCFLLCQNFLFNVIWFFQCIFTSPCPIHPEHQHKRAFSQHIKIFTQWLNTVIRVYRIVDSQNNQGAFKSI